MPFGLTAIRNFHRQLSLPDGRSVQLRALRPDDKTAFRDLFHRLSPTSVRNRFFCLKSELSDAELDYFTEVDFDNHVALAACIEHQGEWQLVGTGRYIRNPQQAQPTAELGFTIDQDQQGTGIGSTLLAQLLDIAKWCGIAELQADIQPDNRAMIRLLEKSGLPVQRRLAYGTLQLNLSLPSALPASNQLPAHSSRLYPESPYETRT